MKNTALTIGLILVTATAALGDWDSGDGHKMHFPQLPDPNGWDVKATTIENPDYVPGTTDPLTKDPYLERKILADDWTCSESGPVADIHFWGSWLDDREGEILNIHLSIHDDDPVGTPGQDPTNQFSKPGLERWSWDGLPAKIAGPFSGEQGWFNPNNGFYTPIDHVEYWQYNIEGFADPFIQQEGTIYWLGITVTVAPPATGLQPEWGWKTADTNQYPDPYTGTHYMDDAVYGDDLDGDGIVTAWHELFDPYNPFGGDPVSLDLAFVIVSKATYWNGDPGVPGDWDDPANWPDGVPDSGTTASVGGGGISVISSDVTVQAIYVNNGGTVQQTGGSITVPDGLHIEQGGYFYGSGTIYGDVINAGLLSICGTINTSGGSGGVTNTGTIGLGSASDPTGILSIVGNYTQTETGTLQVDIGGYAQGVDYDFLDVSGQAVLEGFVDVTVLGGFSPNQGDFFDVLTAAGGITIGSSGLSLTGAPYFEWSLADGDSTLRLTYIPEPATLGLLLVGGLALLTRRRV